MVINQRSPNDVLHCVLIDTSGDVAKLHATDTEIYATASIDVEDECESFVIPVKTLSSICADSVSEYVTFKNAKNVVHVEDGKTKYKIPTHDPMTFPRDTREFFDKCVVESKELRASIVCTQHSVDVASTRYALSGIMLNSCGDGIQVVSTDGRRFSYYLIPTESPEFQAVIPIKTMKCLLTSLNDSQVHISSGGNDVRFVFDGVSITSRVVDGRYPNYQMFLQNRDQISWSSFQRDELLLACKQSTIAQDLESNKVSLRFSEGQLVVESCCDGREFHTVVDSINQGDDFTIDLNSKYITQAISPCGDVVKISSSNSQLLIEDESYFGIIMGMAAGV